MAMGKTGRKMELERRQSNKAEQEKLVSQTFATLLLIVVMAVACIGVFGFVNVVLGSFFHVATSATATTTATTASSHGTGSATTTALTSITTSNMPSGSEGIQAADVP